MCFTLIVFVLVVLYVFYFDCICFSLIVFVLV